MGITVASRTAIKAINKEAEKQVQSLIADYHEWEKSGSNGSPPIMWAQDKGANALRRYADQQIEKASLLARTSSEYDRHFSAAVQARAAAWRKEWVAGEKERERDYLAKQRADRETREHEQAIKPSTKRIAQLHTIIRDAAASEMLLADLYRALKAHDAAEEARKELEHMHSRAVPASFALGKDMPTIDVPARTDDAAAMALIFHRADNAMLR